MVGWGEPRGPKPGDILATAVRNFLAKPTTGNQELLQKALDEYESRRTGIAPPPTPIY